MHCFFFDKQIICFFFQSKETLQYKETYKEHLYYLHKTPKSLRQDSELSYHVNTKQTQETDCFILNTAVSLERTMNGTGKSFISPFPWIPHPSPTQQNHPTRPANLPNGTVLYITIEVQRWPTIDIHRGLREDQWESFHLYNAITGADSKGHSYLLIYS